MHDDSFIPIGVRHGPSGDRLFGLSGDDRRRHLYVIGQTGTGKTTLLRNLIASDLEAGRGVAVIDPHGDLAEELLEHVPPRRADDLVYFNPADRDFPVGLNPLRTVPPDARPLAASGVVSVFKSVWRDSWGPRLEYILHNAAAALLDTPGSTLLGLQRMLVDDRYRERVIRRVRDPIVRSFWENEFARWDRRFMLEAVAPVQNKIGRLLSDATLRNVLGQSRSRVDPRFMMDDRRILIANLSKGRLGEDKSALLGSLLTTGFQLAAMSRADTPEEERADFHLYVDEFQNFTTDVFASILSEARKYRLCLTLGHQYLDQLPEDLRSAAFGNVGSVVAFRVGHADAERLAREFGEIPPRRFSELANHRVLVKILHEGEYGEPFAGRTLPPSPPLHGRKRTLIRRSREKYGVAREVIEERIERWLRNHTA